MNNQMISRTDVRSVQCPTCLAPQGERCKAVRGKEREMNHMERVQRYVIFLKTGK